MKTKWNAPYFSEQDHKIRAETLELIKNRKTKSKRIVTVKEYSRAATLGLDMSNYVTIDQIMSRTGLTHISKIIPKVFKGIKNKNN